MGGYGGGVGMVEWERWVGVKSTKTAMKGLNQREICSAFFCDLLRFFAIFFRPLFLATFLTLAVILKA